MDKLLCIINDDKMPGVAKQICGYATQDLKRCVLRWGNCQFQRPEVKGYRDEPKQRKKDEQKLKLKKEEI